MRVQSTDFYLNLDRWDGLAAVERQRGAWGARLEGPSPWIETIRRDALFEASWGLHLHRVPADARMKEQILGATPPAGKHRVLVQVWRYCRAIQFANGWCHAFPWTPAGVEKLARILNDPAGSADPEARIDDPTVERFLSVRAEAHRLGTQVEGGPLPEVATYYGGMEGVLGEDPTHTPLYLLGLRMLLLQSGYVQALAGPLESAWVERRELVKGRVAKPRRSAAEGIDPDELLGTWLDELTYLLLEVGERAEAAWTQARSIAGRSALQETILSLAMKHGRVTAGDVLRSTPANRNTVKDNLARLVREGTLRKQGLKRGTIYLPA